MGQNQLDEALTLVARYAERGDLSGPADESQIEAAEKELGVVFPPTYREFLRRCGGGGFAGNEWYGIIRDGAPFGWCRTVDKSRDLHGEAGAPKTLVAVSELGDGEVFVLETAEPDADGECPVKC